MAANLELHKVNEWAGLRGFFNLFGKENAAWWGTHRWWVNTLLWTVLLCGLMAIMLFMPNEEVYEASAAQIAAAGGLVPYILILALNVFFEFGNSILAIWTVVLSQDLIIGEKQSGVMEWLLSKPVLRRSYVLAKLAASVLSIVTLMIGLPAALAYAMLCLRVGSPFPVMPFLSAIGIMTAHALFYLTLTIMLGTIFNSRAPILGIALTSVLGGGMVGGFIKPLFYVTPWMLPKVAWMTATSQPVPTEIANPALIATVIWSIVFICVALAKFEKTEC